MQRKIQRAVRIAVVAAAGAASACAAELGNPSGPDAGGSGGDAGQTCFVSVGFEPANPVAGPGLTARANGTVSGSGSFQTYAWRVVRDGVDIPTTPVSADGRDVTFPIEDAGPYDVVLDVPETTCVPFVGTLNVGVAGANTTPWRLVLTPADPAQAPPQTQRVTVPGGADYDVGAVDIERGVLVSGSLTVDGAPAAGYLRVAPQAAPDVGAEGYAVSGSFSLRVVDAPSDLLVIPLGAGQAPARIIGWDPAAPDLALSAGLEVTGTVTQVGSGAVAGARIVLRSDGVPSTIATSAGDGSFTLRARAGAQLEVTVTPPASLGLPRLSATLTGADLALPLSVTFAAAPPPHSLAGVAIRTASGPAPGARVRVTGTIAAAGTIALGPSSASATGTISLDATADGAGLLPALLAPARPVSLVIAPGGTSPGAVVAVDLSAGAPAQVVAPAASTLSATLRDDAAVPVAGARLVARPTVGVGLLPELVVSSGSNGAVSVGVAPGASYLLTIDDPRLVTARRQLGPVAAGALGVVTLESAMAIRGRLTFRGVPAPMAAIAAYCVACTGPERLRPVFEGASDASGRFAIAVPDPGAQ